MIARMIDSRDQQHMVDTFVSRDMMPIIWSRIPLTTVRAGDCYGSLYETNSSVAYFDSFISKPGLSAGEKRRCFGKIVRGLTLLARLKRFTLIVAHTSKRNILGAFSDCGVTVTNEYNNMCYMVVK